MQNEIRNKKFACSVKPSEYEKIKRLSQKTKESQVNTIMLALDLLEKEIESHKSKSIFEQKK